MTASGFEESTLTAVMTSTVTALRQRSTRSTIGDEAVQRPDRGRHPRLRARLGAVPSAEGAGGRAERVVPRVGRPRLRHDGHLRRAGRVPEHAQARGPRREVRELPHDGAVLADAGVAADRTQRDVERHGDDRRVRVGLPRHLDPHPVRERLHLRGARRARVQHLLRREVAPHAGRGVQPRRVQGPLAARPRLRALLRLARWRDQQLVSRPRPRQPPDRPARVGPRTATTWPTTSRTRRSSSSATPR